MTSIWLVTETNPAEYMTDSFYLFLFPIAELLPVTLYEQQITQRQKQQVTIFNMFMSRNTPTLMDLDL